MIKILHLFKWLGIIGGLITLLNVVSIAVFLVIKGDWNQLNFLHSLLLALMFEGLVIALIGSLSFFGFEKYGIWLKGETHSAGPQESGKKTVTDKPKLKLGLFLLTLGCLLFFVAFACFSMTF